MPGFQPSLAELGYPVLRVLDEAGDLGDRAGYGSVVQEVPRAGGRSG